MGLDGALSSDLAGGYSNAWYTTIDRDPFAWAYKKTLADGAIDMVGSQTPNDSLGTLVVGPRWRLLNTKFGQNIPHTDMPKPLEGDLDNPACIPPPYEKTEVKCETGDVLDEPTTINLLDWKKTEPRWADAVSPLAYTSGWTTTWAPGEASIPGQVVTDDDAGRCLSKVDGSCVTSNGTKLTPDFDVSFFVKGDLKPVRMHWVELYVEYLDASNTLVKLQYDPDDEALKGLRHQFTTDDIVADKQGTTDVDDPNVIMDDDLDLEGNPLETVTGDRMQTLRTQTTKETRTINLGKGTYRVKMLEEYGKKGAVSQQVKLAR